MLFEQHIRYVMVYVGHCHDNKLNTIKHIPNLWPITSKLIKPNLVPEPTAQSEGTNSPPAIYTQGNKSISEV